MDNEIKGPVTEVTYCLRHLKSFQMTYDIHVEKKPVKVQIRILFSNHCYTRSRKDNDPDHAVLFIENKRNGQVDQRVFCQERWDFSKKLPIIIQEFHSKTCLPGGRKELFYRQESPAPGNLHEGWYICVRLGASEKHKNLTMSIRSAHYRTNRPVDTRGSPRRFYALLSSFYKEEKHKRGWS